MENGQNAFDRSKSLLKCVLVHFTSNFDKCFNLVVVQVSKTQASCENIKAVMVLIILFKSIYQTLEEKSPRRKIMSCIYIIYSQLK